MPRPNVSCDTRCPTSRTIAEDFLPVALGGGVVGVRRRSPELPDEDEERVSFFHSIKSVGISSRKREPGLYLGVPKVKRYSAREI